MKTLWLALQHWTMAVWDELPDIAIFGVILAAIVIFLLFL